MLKNKGVFIGFAIVVLFSTFGIFRATQASEEVRNLSAREAYDSCMAINSGFSAARQNADANATTTILQATGLRDRFVIAAKLNPPITDKEKVSNKTGLEFFNNLVVDSKTLAEKSRIQIYDETKPRMCK